MKQKDIYGDANAPLTPGIHSNAEDKARRVEGAAARALLAGEVPDAARAEIAKLEADLEAALLPAGPTPEQRLTLYAIRGLLVGIWRCTARLTRGGRGSRSAQASLISLNNCLRRQLQSLELPDKPRPRTLAEALGGKLPSTARSDAQNPGLGPESSPEGPDLTGVA